MYWFNIRILGVACLLSTTAWGQISPIDQAIEYLVEFSDVDAQQLDLVQVAEQLSYLRNNPIQLNTATVDELLELPLFNSFTAFNFIEYRQRTGRIVSFYQLADIKGFSPYLIKLIEPFTTLEVLKKTTLWPSKLTHQAAWRYRQVLQPNRGLMLGNYPGDPSDHYLRYRLQGQGQLFAGLTAQKDPGEVWLTPNSTPDFLSLHAEYRLKKTVRKILVGDYSAEFGQGLILWSSLALNKSSEATTIQRFGRGLRHYTGTDENRFLRGAGTTLNFGKTNATFFVSRNAVDANLNLDEKGNLTASSLQTSGLHRSSSELESRKSMTMNMQGVNILYKPQRLRLATTLLHTQFEHPLQFQDRIENVNRFAGNRTFHTGFDWKWLYHRVFLFGEVAREWKHGGNALTAGLQAQASDALQWVVQFRMLQPRWFAPISAPFTETGREGETGVYFGLNWQLPKNLRLNAFADHFQYTWLRSNLNKPTHGSDYMAMLSLNKTDANFLLRFRYQGRPATVTHDETIRQVSVEIRRSIRAQGNFSISPTAQIQLRTEWVSFSHQSRYESGFLSFVGVSLRPWQRWQFKTRLSIFETNSYASAIWAFEDDVPYTFSAPAFFLNGQRLYAMACFKLNNQIELWMRVANTYLPQEQNIGSGLDQVQGNQRTDIRLMIRTNF